MKQIFLFAVIAMLNIACSKDDVPPLINTYSLEMLDTIRNIFSIDLDASDKSGVNKIELYINDTLVDEGSTIPYSYKWNTLNVNDGNYIVKLLVYDTEGNKTEKTSEIVVNNCLLIIKSYNLAGPYYMVVTDEEGNLLGRVDFDVFMTTYVKPDKVFNGDAINVIWAKKGTYPNLSAWIHVKRGSEYVLGGIPVYPKTKKIKLHVKNDIASFYSLRIATDYTWIEINSIADTVKIPEYIQYTTGHKLLLELYTYTGHFYRVVDINEVSDPCEMSINLSSITNAQEHKSLTLPAGSSIAIISGHAKSTEFDKSYGVFQASARTPIELWYPNSYFESYSTVMNYFPDGTNIVYGDEYNGAVPASFAMLDASFQITNPSLRNFAVNYTGSFDFAKILFYNADKTIPFWVHVPSSKSSWKLPDTGTLFNDPRFNPDNFHVDHFIMTQFQSIDFSKKYFDMSISTDVLHLTDPHSQLKDVRLP